MFHLKYKIKKLKGGMKFMKLKLKKQKGETLAESVVTIAIFGILLIGITDFMSSQINFVARLHHRDEIINKAQILTANNVFKELGANPISADNSGLPSEVKELEKLASFDWDKDKKILIVKDGTEELQFALP